MYVELVELGALGCYDVRDDAPEAKGVGHWKDSSSGWTGSFLIVTEFRNVAEVIVRTGTCLEFVLFGVDIDLDLPSYN